MTLKKKPLPVKFATEKTLGKLTKWLRLLGFDTCEDQSRISDSGTASDRERYRLTRTRKRYEQLKENRCLFIQANEPAQQIREVIRALDISKKDINPYSRCLVCNTLIEPVDKERVRYAIPDYVWEHCDKFCQCWHCRKVYWAGSHTERGLKLIKILFEER